MTADLGGLLPAFQPVARRLLEAVAARGYTPTPRSTSRTRGGRGPDMPHVQCLTVAQQPAFRGLKTEAERDAFVAARLKWPIVG